MKSSAPGLMPLFRSETQLAVLGVLFTGSDRSWTVGELADAVGLGVPTVSREVARLADAGIVTVRTAGRTRLVAANWELSWARPLAELLDRTVGPLARLSEALRGLSGVASAWVYGSWAQRYHGALGPPPRDIDVMVVGDGIDVVKLTVIADRVADRVGLPVNPQVVSVSEWDHPEPGGFIEQVKQSPLVPIPVAAMPESSDRRSALRSVGSPGVPRQDATVGDMVQGRKLRQVKPIPRYQQELLNQAGATVAGAQAAKAVSAKVAFNAAYDAVRLAVEAHPQCQQPVRLPRFDRQVGYAATLRWRRWYRFS